MEKVYVELKREKEENIKRAWRDDAGNGCTADYINAEWCAKNATDKFQQSDGSFISACDAGCPTCAKVCPTAAEMYNASETNYYASKENDINEARANEARENEARANDILNNVNEIIKKTNVPDGSTKRMILRLSDCNSEKNKIILYRFIIICINIIIFYFIYKNKNN